SRRSSRRPKRHHRYHPRTLPSNLRHRPRNPNRLRPRRSRPRNRRWKPPACQARASSDSLPQLPPLNRPQSKRRGQRRTTAGFFLFMRARHRQFPAAELLFSQVRDTPPLELGSRELVDSTGLHSADHSALIFRERDAIALEARLRGSVVERWGVFGWRRRKLDSPAAGTRRTGSIRVRRPKRRNVQAERAV